MSSFGVGPGHKQLNMADETRRIELVRILSMQELRMRHGVSIGFGRHSKGKKIVIIYFINGRSIITQGMDTLWQFVTYLWFKSPFLMGKLTFSMVIFNELLDGRF